MCRVWSRSKSIDLGRRMRRPFLQDFSVSLLEGPKEQLHFLQVCGTVCFAESFAKGSERLSGQVDLALVPP